MVSTGNPGATALLRKATPRLSPREIEVLQLVAEGGTNKQISADLGIAVKTVEKHRHQIMDKLQFGILLALPLRARGGIIEPVHR